MLLLGDWFREAKLREAFRIVVSDWWNFSKKVFHNFGAK